MIRTSGLPAPLHSIALLALLSAGRFATANEVQLHILNAGINLGWANAVLELRGDADPADAALVAASMTRAALHIDMARRGFRLPYREDRRISGVDQRIIDKANGYMDRAPRLSVDRKAGYVKNVWGMYRQTFQTTYVDRPRSDFDRTSGYHYYPACDFHMLDVGYHFGRAQIAAEVQGNRARTFQSGANSAMRAAVENGLKVALDGYPYGPLTNVRKACCFFGSPTDWGFVREFRSDSAVERYRDTLARLQSMVEAIFMPPGTCGGVPRDVRPDHCERKYPGSIPDGKDANGEIICVCPEGYTWNAERTACEKLIPPDRLCARDYPGSVARGRAADGSVNCECPEGFTWKQDRSGCEKLLPPQQLCTRDHPGSVARGRSADGSVNCECPDGFTWKQDRSGCEKQLPPQQLCARDYPGSVARGRSADGSVNCVCPEGMLWNASGTRCIRSTAGRTSRPPRPLCTLDTSLMSGESNLCTSFVEYHDAAGQTRTVHIVNDSQFQRGFSVPSNWHRSRYQECPILQREECPVAPPPSSACTLDTSLISGQSNLCTSFVEYHDAAGQTRTVHIVNDSQFQRGFGAPPTWKRGRYQECQILQREECH